MTEFQPKLKIGILQADEDAGETVTIEGGTDSILWLVERLNSMLEDKRTSWQYLDGSDNLTKGSFGIYIHNTDECKCLHTETYDRTPRNGDINRELLEEVEEPGNQPELTSSSSSEVA